MKYTLEIQVPDDAPVRDGIRLLAAVRERLPVGWKVKTTLGPDKPKRRSRARKSR
jgi:hypothetical protein